MQEIAKKITKKEFSYQADKNSFKEKNVRSKKFLAVFDGFRFSKSTLDYAIHLTREADAYLVGVFLDESIYHSYDVAQILISYKNAEGLSGEMAAKDNQKRNGAVKQFEKACSQADIHYTFHRNIGIAIQELKTESIFADLIIINDNEAFNRFVEDSPTRFIKELLPDVQCSVLVAPNEFKAKDKITLLYDGGPSSVFAIKIFSYLFSNFSNIPIEVFYSE